MTEARRYLPDALGTHVLDEWERGTEVAQRDRSTAIDIWSGCLQQLPDIETPWFERALDFPIAAVLCRSLAEAYRTGGDAATALKHARRFRAHSTNPIDSGPCMVHGMAALDAGETDEVLEAFRQADRIGQRRAFKGYPARYRQFFEAHR